MDPEVRRQLKEIRSIVAENNSILHSLRRNARIGTFFSSMKWLIIIGATIGSYYYALPYINQLIQVYESIQQSASTMKQTTNSLPNISNIADLLKKL